MKLSKKPNAFKTGWNITMDMVEWLYSFDRHVNQLMSLLFFAVVVLFGVIPTCMALGYSKQDTIVIGFIVGLACSLALLVYTNHLTDDFYLVNGDEDNEMCANTGA